MLSIAVSALKLQDGIGRKVRELLTRGHVES